MLSTFIVIKTYLRSIKAVKMCMYVIFLQDWTWGLRVSKHCSIVSPYNIRKICKLFRITNIYNNHNFVDVFRSIFFTLQYTQNILFVQIVFCSFPFNYELPHSTECYQSFSKHEEFTVTLNMCANRKRPHWQGGACIPSCQRDRDVLLI